MYCYIVLTILKINDSDYFLNVHHTCYSIIEKTELKHTEAQTRVVC